MPTHDRRRTALEIPAATKPAIATRYASYAIMIAGFLVAQFGIVRFFNMRMLENIHRSTSIDGSINPSLQAGLLSGQTLAVAAFAAGSLILGAGWMVGRR